MTGGGSLGEGIHTWDMRKTDKPIRAFSWEGLTGSDSLTKDKYYVNPTVNVVKFAPIAGTMGFDTDFIVAGCRDTLRNVNVKTINTRTGEIVNEFKDVQQSCLSLDVSRDGSLACLSDTTGVLHMENVNLIRGDHF